MAFVPVPKDLNRVKTKVMFNLTKRQLICFSIAAAVGVPIFFLAKAHLDLSTRWKTCDRQPAYDAGDTSGHTRWRLEER